MTLGRILSTACAVALIAGCAASQQARDVETSGFLGNDYGLLGEGQENEALLVYRNPSANWAAYDKIKLDPVTIWAGEESGFEDFSQPDRQALADSFYSAIHQELATDYQMVEVLGPGVLHVQVALTDAQTSNPTMDTISSVVPQALLISEAKGASDRQARLRRRGERRGQDSRRCDRRAARGGGGPAGRRQVARGLDRFVERRASAIRVLGPAVPLWPVHRARRYRLPGPRGVNRVGVAARGCKEPSDRMARPRSSGHAVMPGVWSWKAG